MQIAIATLFFSFLFMRTMTFGYLGHAGVNHVDEDVHVLKSEQIGLYDAKVISADNADALIDWLRGNDFRFNEEHKKVFDEYIRKNWCFVVATAARQREGEYVIGRQGMVAPLILRFEVDNPVYPLALTACAHCETQVLLYVLAPYRVACQHPLELRFAMERHIGVGLNTRIMLQCEGAPSSFYDSCLEWPSYLCKFTGRLGPKEMRKDIVFTRDSVQTFHREIYAHSRLYYTYFRIWR